MVGQAADGIDASHPGYLRRCMLPGCEASFHILTGEGLRGVPGWRQMKFVVPGYYCPAHSPELVSGEHLPNWLDRDAPRGVTGSGWEWKPEVPSTQGDHAGQWLNHLVKEYQRNG